MRVLIFSGLIVLCDQVTKLLVRGLSIPALGIDWPGMPYGTSMPVLGNFLRLTYIENPGMAFGIDIGGKLFFSIFSIVASAAIILYLYRARHEPVGFRISLSMILGGAVGNLIDRVFYGLLFDSGPAFHGRVVDFIDVDFIHIDLFGLHVSRFPVFNVADSFVTVGVILLIFYHRSIGATHEETVGEQDQAVLTPGEASPQETPPPAPPSSPPHRPFP